jgi:hypothetical protein
MCNRNGRYIQDNKQGSPQRPIADHAPYNDTREVNVAVHPSHSSMPPMPPMPPMQFPYSPQRSQPLPGRGNGNIATPPSSKGTYRGSPHQAQQERSVEMYQVRPLLSQVGWELIANLNA